MCQKGCGRKWLTFPVEIERNHEALSQHIPGRDWKMSGTARHDWRCYLYISFFLILRFMCLFSTKMEIWDLRAQCQNIHRPGHFLRKAVTLICRPVWWIRFIKTNSCRDVVMSMQEIHAMPRLAGFVTHICIETCRILVTENKLLRIIIKELYYREPLLVTRFIAL